MLSAHTLAQALNSKIDTLLGQYEILKSENEMLRSKLVHTKEQISSLEARLEEQAVQEGAITHEEAHALIEKLEHALDD